MKTALKTSIAGVALALSFNANALIIDTFDTAQAKIFDTTTNGVGVWSSIAAPEALGGWRDIFVNNIISTNPASDPSVVVAGGRFFFDSPSEVNAEARIRWDGTNNTSNSINFGLGGLDLTASGTGFQLNVTFADLNFPFTLNVFTDSLNYTSLTLLSTGAASYFIPFAAFSVPAPNLITVGTGADFTSVGALEAIINTGGFIAAVDLTIADASIAIPEPGTLALLGLSLVGLGAIRRKKAL